jgi:hypothetical protein
MTLEADAFWVSDPWLLLIEETSNKSTKKVVINAILLIIL